MPSVDAKLSADLGRLKHAAIEADARGYPEDLALLQRMSQDLYQRLRFREPGHKPISMPQLAPPAVPQTAGVASAPMPPAPVLATQGPTYLRPPCDPQTLHLHVALGDWQHSIAMRRIADAVLAVSFGGELFTVSRNFGLDPTMLQIGFIVLEREGIEGFMCRLGQIKVTPS